MIPQGHLTMKPAAAPFFLIRSGPGTGVVTSHLGLPDIDGYEVCRLRRDRPAMRLVAITGYSDDRSRSDEEVVQKAEMPKRYISWASAK